MYLIEETLRSKRKPKEKQTWMVEAVVSGDIPMQALIDFFVSAADTDKGTCADVIKHISKLRPEILVPYLDILIGYINYRAPRVKWGIPEAIGNLSCHYPDQVVQAIPYLMLNTVENEINTTVIRWCAAYALVEIAKNNPQTREQLLIFFDQAISTEQNNGVRNVYLNGRKAIHRDQTNKKAA